MVAYFCGEPGLRSQTGLHSGFPILRDPMAMAKPNYAFARRQRDLAKKQKQEEKRRRKAGVPESAPAADTQSPPVPPKPEDYIPPA